jgi:hypothetical protein
MISSVTPVYPIRSAEFAIDDCNNEKNKDCNDRNSNYPIGSHPMRFGQYVFVYPIGYFKRGCKYLRDIPLNVLIDLST